MGNIPFKIVEHLGALSDDKVAVELNLVEWGSRPATYDLRKWKNDEGEKVPYKGMTLSVDELMELKNLLNKIELSVEG